MIGRADIGREFAPVVTEVDGARLRDFVGAIGERDAPFADSPAARAAGSHDAAIPPTYLFCLEMMGSARPLGTLEALGIDIARILHVEQRFEYFAPVCAGDTLTFRSRVADVFQKKGGALTFVVQATDVADEHGISVATMRRTIVVRNEKADR